MEGIIRMKNAINPQLEAHPSLPLSFKAHAPQACLPHMYQDLCECVTDLTNAPPYHENASAPSTSATVEAQYYTHSHYLTTPFPLPSRNPPPPPGSPYGRDASQAQREATCTHAPPCWISTLGFWVLLTLGFWVGVLYSVNPEPQ